MRHTNAGPSAEDDVFQLPLPSERRHDDDADSDTSSTGFEDTDDDDRYGSDGGVEFDPFWSTSESDEEDDDALVIHALLEDTTFTDEIVSGNMILKLVNVLLEVAKFVSIDPMCSLPILTVFDVFFFCRAGRR